jgi:O-antigen ligase
MTSAAFGAAFFLLPLSKSLTLLALAVGTTLLVVRVVAERSTGGPRSGPAGDPAGWPGPVCLSALAGLVMLPLVSLAVHADGMGNLQYASQGYYWLLALPVWAAARRVDVAVWLIAFVAGTLLAFGLAGLVPPEAVALRRPAALGNYILASQFFLMGALVAAMLHRRAAHPAARAACWAATIVLAYGVATGVGRTGQLVLVLLSPLIAAALLPQRSRAIVVGGALLAATAVAVSPQVQTRVAGVVDDLVRWRAGDLQSNSPGYRLEMWRTSAALVAERPIAGHGPQGFQRAWRDRFTLPHEVAFAEPHNVYAFYAAAYGLPGLAAVLVLFGCLLRSGWRHRTTTCGGVVLGFAIMCVVAGLTNTLVLGTTSLLMLVLFTGLSGALPRGARA